MPKWEPNDLTVYDILSIDNAKRREKARRLLKQGIDSKNEWNYYYDCFMWPVNYCEEENEFKEYYGFTQMPEYFGISNGRAFIKIKGLFENYYSFDHDNINFKNKDNSPFERQWKRIEEYCVAENKGLLKGTDGALIKDLMAKPWAWGISFVFDYLGHDIEPKEEPDPFNPGKKVIVASPRETAEYIKKEFFNEDHRQAQMSIIGGKSFSTISIWLVMKLLGAEKTEKRNLCIFTHKWDDGDEQSYLKITADNNEAYICSSANTREKLGENK